MSVSERSADKERFAAVTTEAKAILQPLHDALSEEESYGGLIYYATPDALHTSDANAVLDMLPEDMEDTFARRTIVGRRIRLGSTAFAQALKDKQPEFRQSKMNPNAHLTWATAVRDNDVAIGGLQTVFNVNNGFIPGQDSLERLWHHFTPAIEEAGHLIHELEKPDTSLGNQLELLPPKTPTHFILRWDLVDSTTKAATNYGALRRYLSDIKGAFAQQLKDIDSAEYGLGDGQNIVIPIPEDALDQNSAVKIRMLLSEFIRPLGESMDHAAFKVGRNYPELRPIIHIAAGIGNLEVNDEGELDGPELYQVARGLKQPASDSPVVRYTPALRHIASPHTKSLYE